MEAIRTHVAGVDVHKKILAITVLIGDGNESPRIERFECSTFTDDLMAMGIKFLELGVKDVAMESTGIYWKPLHNVWAPMGINVTVGNATHMKNVPGRKTDMNDAHWIAQLHRFGLIRSSFIPESEFQKLRLLSRHRTNLVDDLSRVKNRVQKILEDGNVKLSSVVSDVFGAGSMKVLRLIANGQKDAETLRSAIKTNIKNKEELKKSLTNCLTGEHCFLIQELMFQYDSIKERIRAIDNEIVQKIHPYSDLVEELKKIPGISDVLATGILAEASNDMSSFADERKFAAWAGVASGNNESAGKKKRAKTRRGNPHLRKLLVQAAQNATKKRGSFYRSKYNKLKFRLGSANKAKVAIANRLARAIFKILGGENYKDLGYMRGNPDEEKIKGLVMQLKNLGVNIKHLNHELIFSVRKVKVNQDTGEIVEDLVTV
jgi:transposase